MTNSVLNSKAKFLVDHIFAGAAGAVIGWTVSDTIEGAITGGVLNTLMTSQSSTVKQFFVAASFGGMKMISSTFFNRDFTALTPLLWGVICDPYATNAAYLTTASLGLSSHFFSPIFSYFTNASYIKPAWEFAGDVINMVFQYRIAQGIGLFLMGYALISNSKEKSQHLAVNDITIGSVVVNELKKATKITDIFWISISNVLTSPLCFFNDFGDLWLEATTVNYITSQKFGNSFWLIPTIGLIYGLKTKYDYFYGENSMLFQSTLISKQSEALVRHDLEKDGII